MWLFAGLGNPGDDYAKNRHNIGFMAAEAIARRHNFSPFRKKYQGQVAEGTIGNEKVLLLMPETYMNESGISVQAAMAFYKIKPENLVVFYDELDLEPGRVRVKRSGGSGGHNGIRSIDAHIGPDYWRVRLGIGHPGDKNRVSDYVLSNFAKADQSWLDALLSELAEQAGLLTTGQDSLFMTRLSEKLFSKQAAVKTEEVKS